MGLKVGHRSEYGKPSASFEARSVWNGGKAARPYLSLHMLHAIMISEHISPARILRHPFQAEV
jgi:hypothetical protein